MASRKEAKSKAQMRKDKMKCNKPQRAPKGASQKYIVKACAKGDEKIVRFGYRGMQDFLQHKIIEGYCRVFWLDLYRVCWKASLAH